MNWKKNTKNTKQNKKRHQYINTQCGRVGKRELEKKSVNDVIKWYASTIFEADVVSTTHTQCYSDIYNLYY